MTTVKISDWVAELRRGDYLQKTGVLKGLIYPTDEYGQEDGDVVPIGMGYCCLGVLCEKADRFNENNEAEILTVDGDTGDEYVDTVDVELAGATLQDLLDAAVRYNPEQHDDKSFQHYLVTLNDIMEYSFDQIADEIEKYCDPDAEIRFP